MSKNLIIAIDGPAGSGKSTTAKIVAQKLDFLYIDTGAMYRAMTYLALRNNILGDKNKIVELAKRSEIELNFISGVTQVKVKGENLTDHIRTIEVNKNVSKISKIEGLRKILVKKQREMATIGSGVVMEGRDIGTIVFPNADVKVYLTAIIDERAKRRAKEYAEIGKHVSLNEIKSNLQYRDITDSNRETSPLMKAADAIVGDTIDVSIKEQVDLILNEVKNKADILGIEININ